MLFVGFGSLCEGAASLPRIWTHPVGQVQFIINGENGLRSYIRHLMNNKNIVCALMNIRALSPYRVLSFLKLTRQPGFDLLQIAIKYISEFFDSDVHAFLPNIHNELELYPHLGVNIQLEEKEKSIANWVFELGQPAGLGTSTLSFSKALYLPLKGTNVTVGVLRIQPKDVLHFNTPDVQHLLESCVQQIALALEVDLLEEQNKKLSEK